MNLLRLFLPKSPFLLGQQQQSALFHSSIYWCKLVQYNLSDIGEGIAEVQIREWHVKEGDVVNEFDELCLVQSDKASVTITSRYNGKIQKLYYKPDDIAKVGKPLVDIEIPDEETEVPEQAPLKSITLPNATAPAVSPTKLLASPSVRRLIREYGVEASNIVGSGRDGRVLKEDILKLVQNLKGVATLPLREQAEKIFPTKLDNEQASTSDDEADERKVPIRGYNRIMVKTMTEALKIPHFGYSDEMNADGLIEAKTLLTSFAVQKGVKMTFMPIIIKATSLVLLEYPQLNASLDEKMENLLYKRSHNISLAMDTPAGLAVPNIRNCQGKSIWRIAVELNRLLERGREGRLSKEDLNGGTFTLSNIGSIGGTYMSPVILPPQVAIGAIGSIRKVPCFDEQGNLVGRNVMNISWSADHRVVDGATMARFSNRLKQFLENPALMLAELR